MTKWEFWFNTEPKEETECDVCGEFGEVVHSIASGQGFLYALCYDCFVGPERKES